MSPNLKEEVNLRCCGRHLGKLISRHNSARGGPIWKTNLVHWCKIKTGSRIPIWRPFVFKTGSICISTMDLGKKAANIHV